MALLYGLRFEISSQALFFVKWPFKAYPFKGFWQKNLKKLELSKLDGHNPALCKARLLFYL